MTTSRLSITSGAVCVMATLFNVFLCIAVFADPAAAVYPATEWEYDESGISQEVAFKLEEFIESLETTGLMVIVSGRVAFQYGDVEEVSYIASVRKSVLSMLYGSYVDDGTINLEETLADLGISDVGGLLPTEERAMVSNLLASRSGIYHPACFDSASFEYSPERGSEIPGSYWLYNNWDFNVAGTIFELKTGKRVYDALRDDLAGPLGMQDFDRERQRADKNPDRSKHSQYTMWLSTRDMARLGYLMLREGRWMGRQIIPAKWVERSTHVVTPVSEMHPDYMLSSSLSYGLMWWVWDSTQVRAVYKGAYTASGAHGQWITILPRLDMVVAHKTFWSSTGGSKNDVDRQDYFHILEILTGIHPSSSEVARNRTGGAVAQLSVSEQAAGGDATR